MRVFTLGFILGFASLVPSYLHSRYVSGYTVDRMQKIANLYYDLALQYLVCREQQGYDVTQQRDQINKIYRGEGK